MMRTALDREMVAGLKRIAADHPETRKALLPLIKRAAAPDYSEGDTAAWRKMLTSWVSNAKKELEEAKAIEKAGPKPGWGKLHQVVVPEAKKRLQEAEKALREFEKAHGKTAAQRRNSYDDKQWLQSKIRELNGMPEITPRDLASMRRSFNALANWYSKYFEPLIEERVKVLTPADELSPVTVDRLRESIAGYTSLRDGWASLINPPKDPRGMEKAIKEALHLFDKHSSMRKMGPLKRAASPKSMKGDLEAFFQVFGGSGKPAKVLPVLRLRQQAGRIGMVTDNAKWALQLVHKLLDEVGKAEGGKYRVYSKDILVMSASDEDMLVYKTPGETALYWDSGDHPADIKKFEAVLKMVCKKNGWVFLGVDQW